MYAILSGQWEVEVRDDVKVGDILTLQFLSTPAQYIVRVVSGQVAIVELYT